MKFDELSGSHSEFHGQSSCIPALQRWSYARYHFAYLKWEGELNMFMSFLMCFEKIKLIILRIKTVALIEGPFINIPTLPDFLGLLNFHLLAVFCQRPLSVIDFLDLSDRLFLLLSTKLDYRNGNLMGRTHIQSIIVLYPK